MFAWTPFGPCLAPGKRNEESAGGRERYEEHSWTEKLAAALGNLEAVPAPAPHRDGPLRRVRSPLPQASFVTGTTCLHEHLQRSSATPAHNLLSALR